MTAIAAPSKYVGDDWVFPLTWQDSNGNPVNLTGYTVGGVFVTNGMQSDLTTGNGGVVVTNAAGGQFSIVVDKTVTATIAPSSASSRNAPTRIQVYVIEPSGNRTTLAVLPISVITP